MITVSNSSTNQYAIGYSTNDLINSHIKDTPNSSSGSSKSGTSSSSSSSYSGSYTQSLISQMSGIDVNSMTNEMMTSDYLKLNTLLAKQQTTQWTQDRYRTVITNLNTFNSNYFDVLSSNYMLSSKNYSIYSAASSSTASVTASASGTAQAGTYTIKSAQLATAPQIIGSTNFSNSGTITNSSKVSSLGLSGTLNFNVIVNGVTKPVSYDLDKNSDKTIGQFMSNLSSQAGVNFSYSELNGRFAVSGTTTGGSQNISIVSTDSTGNTDTVLNNLFGNSQSATGTSNTPAVITGSTSSGTVKNSTTLADALSTLGGAGSTLNFTVNGKSLTYDLSASGANGNKTIGSVMSDLSTLSGANFSYSDATGNFSVATNTAGANQSLTISSSDASTQSVLKSLFGIDLTNSHSAAGQDGSFNIIESNGNSDTITKSSNIFSIDGVNYNFTNNISSSSPVTIGVTMNVSSVVTKIQNFVNDYNNLIGGIQDAVNEKKNYNYKILTTMQESQMSSSEITEWNNQAQKGLMANDSTLNSMLTDMRKSFYTPVNGNGLTMADIGLSTSNDYTQGGKLTLDVNKLTSALQKDPQKVIDLFTQASTSYSSYTSALNSSDARTALSNRSKEEGIFQRLSDIYQKYAGTNYDKNGNQGILLMKAGMSNTSSDTKNTLTKQLKQQQQAVDDFKTTMNSHKTTYSNKFTKLQSALSQLGSQQTYLSSFLSK